VTSITGCPDGAVLSVTRVGGTLLPSSQPSIELFLDSLLA
jgi:hypothetical protein